MTLSASDPPPPGLRGDLAAADLSISSCYHNLAVAECALVECCYQAKLAEEDREALVIALQEAAANAIRHGNRNISSRRVRIRIELQPTRASITVADEGAGFDPASVPDPTRPENLLRPCGRGIFYMRRSMTRVEFSRVPSGGSSVTMTRCLDPQARRRKDEI